jgi:hypothetical protein
MSKIQKSLVLGLSVACFSASASVNDLSPAAQAAGTSASAPSSSNALADLKNAVAQLHTQPTLTSSAYKKLKEVASYYEPALALKDARAVMVSVGGKTKFAHAKNNPDFVGAMKPIRSRDFSRVGISEDAISRSLRRAGIPLYSGRADRVPSDVVVLLIGGYALPNSKEAPQYAVSYESLPDRATAALGTKYYDSADVRNLQKNETARLLACWKLAQNPSFIDELQRSATTLNDVPYVGLKYVLLKFHNKNEHWPDDKFISVLKQQLADAGLQVVEPNAVSPDMQGVATLWLDFKVTPDYPKRRKNGRLVISKERPRGYNCSYTYEFSRLDPDYKYRSGPGTFATFNRRLERSDDASRVAQELVADLIRSSKRAKFI